MRRRFATSVHGISEVSDVTDVAQTEAGQPEGLLRVDSLRLEVAPDTGADGAFQLLVYVDDVEMTSAGAGLGMDPYDVIIPTNLLVAAAEPHTVPIARCDDCGVYGCGSTDITITRRGDLVHWDWLLEVPMNRGVSFNAADYDREITRVASDHSWETPERTAGRLILTQIDRKHLLSYGLAPHWVSPGRRNPELFRVALQIANEYQVFVDTPWLGRTPEQLAAAVRVTLDQPPDRWTATWHAIKPSLATAPTVARQPLATRTALTTPLDETQPTTPRVRRLPLSDPLLSLPASERQCRSNLHGVNHSATMSLGGGHFGNCPLTLRTRGGPRPA